MPSFLGFSFGFIPVSDTNASSEITGSGTVNTVAKFTAGQVIGNSTITDTGTGGLVTVGNKFAITQPVATTGSPTGFLFTGGAHTTLTSSTEAIDVNVNMARTVEFATGALATQRAFVVQAPTYGFVGASVITTAATLAISGAPVAGTNATITNAYALWIQGGRAQFSGTINGMTLTNTTGTFTLAAGKTFTVNNTLTVAASSDGFTLTVPATGTAWLDVATVQTLTDAAPIAWDVSAGVNAVITMVASRTLAISNAVAGHYYTLRVVQGGSGSYALTLPATSKVVNGGTGAIVLSTAVGSIDILTVYYDGTTYYWTYGLNFT